MAAFVPGFKYDVFVSYAQVDNEPFPGTVKGWISTLAEGLENLMPQKLGGNFSLMHVQLLPPNQQVTPKIENILKRTAILIVILSPSYLSSETCPKEREVFLSAVDGQACSRLFIVEATKIELAEKHEEFRKAKGYYHFWILDEKSKLPRKLGYPQPNPNDPYHQPYYNILNDIAEDLAKELNRLKLLEEKASNNKTSDVLRSSAEEPDSKTKESDVEPEESVAETKELASKIEESETKESEREEPDTRPAVFLADVTPDLSIKRDEVRRYLDQAGCKILPDKPLSPDDTKIFREAWEKELENCKAFVQLLSNMTGRRNSPSFCQIQYECALKTKKPIIQWRDTDLDLASIQDQEHQDLLKCETVVAVNFEAFKREVVERVSEIVRQESSKSPDTDGCSDALVFLNANKEDDLLAQDISNIMYNNEVGCISSLWEGEAEESEIQEDFKDNLIDCDGVIVIYGLVSVVWVRRQLRELRKIMSRRTQLLKAFAVCDGPPKTKAPLKFQIPKMITLNCRDGLNAAQFEPFFNALRQGGDA
jgi:hypothetical protein